MNGNINKGIAQEFADYQHNRSILPMYFCGDVIETLQQLPENSIDCCITSPPYWGQRQYSGGGIGLEKSPKEFISNLLCRDRASNNGYYRNSLERTSEIY